MTKTITGYLNNYRFTIFVDLSKPYKCKGEKFHTIEITVQDNIDGGFILYTGKFTEHYKSIKGIKEEYRNPYNMVVKRCL